MGLGFGIIGTTGALGMVLGPYITGSLRDLTGDYLWSFNAMAILSALGMIPTLLIKKQLRK
jgi:MFS family permease